MDSNNILRGTKHLQTATFSYWSNKRISRGGSQTSYTLPFR